MAMVDPAEVAMVTVIIVDALVAGGVTGPDGDARWAVVDVAPGDLAGNEHDLAERLGRTR